MGAILLQEYEKHIADTHVDGKGKAICGAALNLDWHFSDVDHAFLNARNGGFLMACPARVRVIIETLKTHGV